VAIDPLLMVQWNASLLRTRTATGPDEEEEEEAPKPGDAKDAPKPEEAAGKKEDLGTIRGLELPRGLEKPVLVYFHWPHEDGEKGKRVVKFCSGPLDDESFVRVTPLFHCVEVNIRDSEPKLVEESPLRSAPSLAVCRPDGTVVWRSEDTGHSGRGLAETLKKVLRARFPGEWEKVERESAEQKKSIAEARRLLAADKVEEAKGLLGGVVDSLVRFTDEWAQAVKLLREEERKAEEAAKKK